MHADLHSHTTASDGQLSPAELIKAAISAGVTLLSITDHDTVDAYEALADEPNRDLQLIPGIELSSQWRSIGIHILGLNIDPAADSIRTAVRYQRDARMKRARLIAAKLEKNGFRNVLKGAESIAANGNIGRPHFAQYLYESGQIKSETRAFKKFLGQGKCCDIRNVWPAPDQVIHWIHDAGGKAVLAHPAKYKLTNMKMEELTREFRDAGGDGLEIISGAQQPSLTDRLHRLANRHGLSASCGSDFHRHGQPWAVIGAVEALPDGARPVWENW